MYDIAVIGGGLLGAGIARDAALRGLSVVLFEREDFGAGATSRGSRVLSAGLRALETLDFTHVREELHEREILLQIAPHLVVPLPCLIPFYDSSLLAQTRLRASLALTDALGFDKSLPLHQILSAAEAREREPSLKAAGLAGAALVWEAHVPQVERLALEIGLDARAHGASLRTHTHVDELRRIYGQKGKERVGGVCWTNRLTGESGEIAARLVVNAAGAGLPEVDHHLKALEGVSQMRRKCTLAAIPSLRGGRDALLLPREEGRELLFVVPWQGLALIGPLETPTDTNSLETLYATSHEVVALLHPLREFLSDADWEKTVLTVTGTRVSPPFPGPPALPDTNLPLLLDHAASGGRLDGLLSVAGGTLLSCRSLAEEVVDMACRKLGRALSTPACRTSVTPLPGAFDKEARRVLSSYEASDLRSAIERAVELEECQTICDFLERRTALFWTPDQGRSAVPVVLEAMATKLGWDAARQVQEVKAWEADAALTQAFRVM